MRKATYSHEGDGGLSNSTFVLGEKQMNKTTHKVLLATAALTAFSTMAQAGELSDLKTMIESLTISDAASMAGLQAPRGYKVSPTADTTEADAAAVEEPYIEVKTSGYLKSGYIYNKIKDGSPADKSSDIDLEAGVNVKGSVQSPLGEVGVTVQAKWDVSESSNNSSGFALRDEGAIGFWQFTDTMKFEMGRSNAGRLENGIDKNTKRLWTFANRRVRAENAGNGFFDRDAYNGFLGLAYASGPLSLNMRIHDATRGITGKLGSDDDAHGVSAKGLFASEMINFEATGGYWGQSDAKNLPIANQKGVKWLAGVGTELNFIPGVPISVGMQTGRLHNDTKTLNMSTSVGFTLTDNITAGIGAGWKKVSESPTATDNVTERMLHAEIYYAPMSYLLLGVEGDLYDDGKPAATSNDGFAAAFVSRFSF
jgi:hypothetical protein